MKFRIAFISCEYPPDTGKGGIGTYTEQIATSLASMGWDVHVFAGSPTRQCKESINAVSVHWVLYGSPNDFHLNVVSLFKKEHSSLSFDMMECAEIQGNAWEIKKIFPEIPLVVRLHAPSYLVDSLKNKYVPFFAKLRFVIGAIKRKKIDLGYWRAYEKMNDPDYAFIQLANYITAPSQAMKQWVVEHWGIPEKNITVITNLFYPSFRWLNIPINERNIYKRIVFFGRLNVLKGLVNCCKAIKNVLIDNPDWKFRIIGDDGPGPYAIKSMKVWIQVYLKEVIEQVEFIDGLSYGALPDAIADSEIVILPSLFESFSYTCAEAMAAGKAIIGSKKGGMKDLLQDNHSGLLIDPESVSEIQKALKKLVLDNNLRYRLSVNARKRIQNDFHSALINKRYSAYYQNIFLNKLEGRAWNLVS